VRTLVQLVAALAIPLWGLSFVVVGLARGVALWSAIGAVVAVAGLPLLGGHPWARPLLYRPRGPLEGPSAASAEPADDGAAGASAGASE